MKRIRMMVLILAVSSITVSCAVYPTRATNTEVGAALGAGMGALIGQAIGGDTKGTIAGLAAGTILGALVGNAQDQAQSAMESSAVYGKPVIYYDEEGRAVEAIPEPGDDPDCYTVRKRVWDKGTLVEETVEKVCTPWEQQPGVEYPPAGGVYDPYPPSPPPPPPRWYRPGPPWYRYPPPPGYWRYPPPRYWRPPPPPIYRHNPYGPRFYYWWAPRYWGEHHKSGDR